MFYAYSHCSVYRCSYCIDSTLFELPTAKEKQFLLPLISKLLFSNVPYFLVGVKLSRAMNAESEFSNYNKSCAGYSWKLEPFEQ